MISCNSGNKKVQLPQVPMQKRKDKGVMVKYRITLVGEYDVSEKEMDKLKVIYDKAKNMDDIIPLFRNDEGIDVGLEVIEKL